MAVICYWPPGLGERDHRTGLSVSRNYNGNAHDGSVLEEILWKFQANHWHVACDFFSSMSCVQVEIEVIQREIEAKEWNPHEKNTEQSSNHHLNCSRFVAFQRGFSGCAVFWTTSQGGSLVKHFCGARPKSPWAFQRRWWTEFLMVFSCTGNGLCTCHRFVFFSCFKRQTMPGFLFGSFFFFQMVLVTLILSMLPRGSPPSSSYLCFKWGVASLEQQGGWHVIEGLQTSPFYCCKRISIY